MKIASGTEAGLSETRKLASDAAAASLPADTRNQIRLLRFQALVAAAAENSPASPEEAALLARERSQLGASWSRRMQQIALALPDPRGVLGSTASTEWIAAENLAAEEKPEPAIPAYERVQTSAPVDSEEATLVLHRLGVCYFRSGSWRHCSTPARRRSRERLQKIEPFALSAAKRAAPC